MPDRLAQLLESLGTPHAASSGATFTFRSVEAAGSRWLVLSRFVARGLDYTRRDNRLAHHLVFRDGETGVLPPPAAIAYRWKGWKDEWSEQACWLDGADRPIALSKDTPLTPAMAWREETGTGSKAAWLVKGGSAAPICLINAPETLRTLRLLAESSALLGDGAWSASFTTDSSVTGSEGFDWSVGQAPGRADHLDLALAASLPAPTGPAAKVAATGMTASQGGTPVRAIKEPARKESGPSGLLIGITAIALLAAIGLGVVFMRTPDAPPAAPPTPLAPVSAADIAKADEIMRANAAISAIGELIAREEFVDAAKLWLESVSKSPEFSRRHSAQHLPGLRSRYAAGSARRLSAELDRKGPAGAKELMAAVGEAIEVGRRLEVPQDSGWEALLKTEQNVRVAASLELRPVTLILGEWLTVDAGPKSPSRAEMRLNIPTAELFSSLIASSGATMAKTVDVRLRLTALSRFHRHDDSKFKGGEIRRVSQTDWIESRPDIGGTPAIAIAIGARSSGIMLSFPDGQGGDRKANRLLEIEFPGEIRRAFALVASPELLEPVNLGPGALMNDPDTMAVKAAPWAESVLQSFELPGGAIGLYPSFHGFPDRDLPSRRAAKSLVETDLIRMQRSIDGTPKSVQALARRRELLEAGDTLGAGLPWVLRAVDSKGSAGPVLFEFR